MYNVVKRDGSKEAFVFDKLLASITKAGVPVKEAVEIANKVQSWIESNSKDTELLSTTIRDKITELLSVNYPVEADNYQAFKKG